jgi:hypothetical protein
MDRILTLDVDSGMVREGFVLFCSVLFCRVVSCCVVFLPVPGGPKRSSPLGKLRRPWNKSGRVIGLHNEGVF